MNVYVIVGIILLVLVVLAIAAISIRSQRGDVMEERLGRYTENQFQDIQDQVDRENAEANKGKEKGPSALVQLSERLLTAQGVGAGMKQQLARADLRLTVTEYLALHVIGVLGLFSLTFLVLVPGQIVQAIIAGGIGFFIPRLYVSNKQSSRLKNFEKQLPDILGLWVNALRSGYSNMQSLEAISKEAPQPSAGEIRRVVQEQQLGIPQEQALDHLLERMPSEDLDLIVTAINVQREVGGNLAEILEIISHTIRERIKLKGEIGVLTAQGRITGYLISGLPIVLALFLLVINPNYMGKLVENRLCGWPMIVIGLGMIGMGTAVIQKIVDIEI